MTEAPLARRGDSRLGGAGGGDEAALVAAGTIDLLRDASEAYPAWLDAIAGATSEIVLEMYWFGSDRTGWKFANALMERARAGVDVRVLYDALGSIGTDRGMFHALTAAGAQVREFHPLAPWRRRFSFSGLSRRDHRKILVVDDSVAFTGGININDAAAPREEGGGGWRDDAVRVTGPAAEELRRLFFDTWLKIGGEPPRHCSMVAPRHALALVQVARTQTRVHLRLAEAPELAQVIGHAAFGAHRVMRREYLSHIRAARERILISNAYFVPDSFVRRALQQAARRGVKVHVIVPESSDVPSVSFASSAMWGKLMRAGVHIHLWTDGMIHAKSAVIDGWATVGSYNLDYRSLLYNLEVNIACSDVRFVGSLAESFRADLTHTTEVDRAAWPRRPFPRKVLEWIFYGLRKLL